ncbi:RNA-binding protein [candidate division WWE3 bacterium RIFCSPHIGHO2_12_FULL_38_15]|uniref:RNA-binding protein n=1 Tax=candidate division WWE3 bacterium RIFCSPHIGHO2_02_FULL_38_14 TaxID=1802620 RepID=A0A1F4V992_UNCKA|nr:MAG: RNA-binding protein [candidate division WWE3 bacterium RIFCSPHIGHO2_01_FULL_38_45]OGC48917.1 MAG: RNA-binding protein [candidate division WWE3 bacterium RIFCSPHIGHO2_12_FULL_38_15]OGC52976.1 MAG: RNA-binding protein [candidate division WWE3 bacterium RIFCSPLOWO2_01_FULL_37_24]OGC53223.1 MAG: RNA-binding protein [candidate division WWE3 bacterium RIFCSPHIGHO2_02_FULL_38_14]
MTKLYVGNLPYSYTDNDLRDMFAPYGEVSSASIIMDKVRGRSKGFGFVEMDDSAAQTAVAELNGKDIGGRNIVVSEARPMTDKPRREYDRNSRGPRQ